MDWRNKPRRIFGVVVNSILIVAIATFLFSYGRHFVTERSFATASISPDGKTITMAGVDFSKFDQTVLLALDKNCRFCLDETPFYRKLAELTRAKGVGLIGVFQHDMEAGKQYLSKEQIALTETARVRFNSLLIDSTPTLFLLNRNGNIIGKWAGRLSDPVHEYIISILGMNEEMIRKDGSPYLSLGNRNPPPVLDAGSAKYGLKTTRTMTLLDIDDRKVFAKQHIAGAVNLPSDEIYARAQNELSPSRMIVIFSRSHDSRRITNARFTLQQIGFGKIAWLKLTLEECKSSGLEITSPN